MTFYGLLGSKKQGQAVWKGSGFISLGQWRGCTVVVSNATFPCFPLPSPAFLCLPLQGLLALGCPSGLQPAAHLLGLTLRLGGWT